VTAVNVSAVGLDRGRRLADARGVVVDWVRADLRDYQADAGTFQPALIAYLQLRAAELDGVLRRAVTALAPRGVLLALGHDMTNLTEGTGGPPDPAVLYTPWSIARSLGGITVLRAERSASEGGARSAAARQVWGAEPASSAYPYRRLADVGGPGSIPVTGWRRRAGLRG